ncbi:unnamed protein product [Rotaria socialis]|uniref:Uncharacterized protein n=1 Tax=Rotaria socialis TaxID=392032 RepID=A0A820WXA3_9BILA|nr:unnamed protein product [Rotaria socialis]CAF3344700.1 unnamed protein product [Rotaria socialis]CAF3346204.1 unnamed protein product [Rotaria socialis]CAF3378734.1 unnamed protein product [Rotaria socialis]CAF4106246.1 unnamed protein product [Rotaria socialis]
MNRIHVMLFVLVFLFCNVIFISSSSSNVCCYAIRQFQGFPCYGSIFNYNLDSSAFRFYANFSFQIHDNTADLYYFEAGLVAVVNNTYSTIYMPLECGTSFQRLLLLKYDLETKIYKQSR